MPLQFFCVVSIEIVHGCGSNQKLCFRAGADTIRGALGFSANKTRNLSIMQTSLDGSGVMMTQAVCYISLFTFHLCG